MQKRVVYRFIAAASLAALLSGCSRGNQEVSEPAPEAPAPVSEAPEPAGQKRAACEQEIAIVCPDGMSDGCGRQGNDGAPLTNYHVCLPNEEASAPPCEQEIGRQCGDGLVDACLVQPPAAATHLCVQSSEKVAPGNPGE